jgi:predicted DNA-binding ribbon-helix-helix protein
MLGQKGVGADVEKLWSRLIHMIIKGTKPKVVRAVSFNGEASGKNLEKTFLDILDEQRKTRLLLERLVDKIEQGGTTTKSIKGYSA